MARHQLTALALYLPWLRFKRPDCRIHAGPAHCCLAILSLFDLESGEGAAFYRVYDGCNESLLQVKTALSLYPQGRFFYLGTNVFPHRELHALKIHAVLSFRPEAGVAVRADGWQTPFACVS